MKQVVKDGYYISNYVEIDKLGNVLKVSARHDHNISLWEKRGQRIKLLRHWELERLSGYKHHRIPFFSLDDYYEFVDCILKREGLGREKIVGYIGLEGVDKSISLPPNDSFSIHSLCHLYASMGMDSKVFYNSKILGLALDGEPDVISDPDLRNKDFYAGGYTCFGQTHLFPISSPGALWTEAVELLKMPEGTLMALATASTSESYENFDFPLELKNNADVISVRPYVRNVCDTVFKYVKSEQGIKYNHYDASFTEKENKISMIMKIIQKVSMQIVDKNIETAIVEYDIKPEETYIALNGGYALNCPTNTHIMNKYHFKKQLMIPCVNDGGQSIGMGLYYFYNTMDTVEFEYSTPYLGDGYSSYDNQFEEYIEEKHNDLTYIVSDIEKAPIIWYEDRAESGPRALGHRSLLADPRKIHSKDKLNIIKKREWWRPVAPIIIENICSEWFENSFDSEYMLNNFVIRKDKQIVIPAVSHLDGTSRVQTIFPSDDLLYKTIKLFYQETGVPVLCNTSLNDKNEPIINSIDQTFNFALRKGIDIVYINGNRYKLKNHDKYHYKEPLKRNPELFIRYDKDAVKQEINPYGITDKEYGIYKINPGFRSYDFTNIEEVTSFKRAIRLIKHVYDKSIGTVHYSYENEE